VQGFIAKYPDRVAMLTLVCPTVLNPRSLAPLGARLMVLTGDHGLGARRVQAEPSKRVHHSLRATRSALPNPCKR